MLLEERIKLIRHVITTSIKLKCLDTFTQLVFRFCLKCNEFVQGIILSTDWENISEPRVLLRKHDELLMLSSCMDIKRLTHVSIH